MNRGSQLSTNIAPPTSGTLRRGFKDHGSGWRKRFVRERFVFDYAVIRVVPRVDRGEFLNAGVILFSSTAALLDCRIELDHARLRALSPTIDVAVVESYLDAIPTICAGGGEAGSIGDLPQRARF